MVSFNKDCTRTCDPTLEQTDQFAQDYKDVKKISIKTLTSNVQRFISLNLQESSKLYSLISKGSLSPFAKTKIKQKKQIQLKQKDQLTNLSDYLTYKFKQFTNLQNSLKYNVEIEFKKIYDSIKNAIKDIIIQYRKILQNQLNILRNQTDNQLQKVKSELRRLSNQIQNHTIKKQLKSHEICQISGYSIEQIIGYTTMFKIINYDHLLDIQKQKQTSQIKKIVIDDIKIKKITCQELFYLIQLTKTKADKSQQTKSLETSSNNLTLIHPQIQVEKQEIIDNFQVMTFQTQAKITEQLSAIMEKKQKQLKDISKDLSKDSNSIDSNSCFDGYLLSQFFKQQTMSKLLKISKRKIQKQFEQYNQRINYNEFILNKESFINKDQIDDKKEFQRDESQNINKNQYVSSQNMSKYETYKYRGTNDDVRHKQNNSIKYQNLQNNYYDSQRLQQIKYDLNNQDDKQQDDKQQISRLQYEVQQSEGEQQIYPQDQQNEIQDIIKQQKLQKLQAKEQYNDYIELMKLKNSQYLMNEQKQCQDQIQKYKLQKLLQQQQNELYQNHQKQLAYRENQQKQRNNKQLYRKQKDYKQQNNERPFNKKMYNKYQNQQQKQTYKQQSSYQFEKQQRQRQNYYRNLRSNHQRYQNNFLKHDQQKQQIVRQWKQGLNSYNSQRQRQFQQQQLSSYIAYDYGSQMDQNHRYNQIQQRPRLPHIQIPSLPTDVNIQQQHKLMQQFQKMKSNKQQPVMNPMAKRFNNQIHQHLTNKYQQQKKQYLYPNYQHQKATEDFLLQQALNQSKAQVKQVKPQQPGPIRKFFNDLATNLTTIRKSQDKQDQDDYSYLQLLLTQMFKKKPSFSLQQSDYKYNSQDFDIMDDSIDFFPIQNQKMMMKKPIISNPFGIEIIRNNPVDIGMIKDDPFGIGTIKNNPFGTGMIRNPKHLSIKQIHQNAHKLSIQNEKPKFSIIVKVIKPVSLTFVVRDKTSNRPMTKFIVGDSTGMAILFMNYVYEVQAGCCLQLQGCTLHRYRDNSFEINHHGRIGFGNILASNSIAKCSDNLMLSQIRKAGYNQYVYQVKSEFHAILADCVKQFTRIRMSVGQIILRKPIIVTVCEINPLTRMCILGDYSGKIRADLSQVRYSIHSNDTLLIRRAKLLINRGEILLKVQKSSYIVQSNFESKFSHEMKFIPNRIF